MQQQHAQHGLQRPDTTSSSVHHRTADGSVDGVQRQWSLVLQQCICRQRNAERSQRLVPKPERRRLSPSARPACSPFCCARRCPAGLMPDQQAAYAQQTPPGPASRRSAAALGCHAAPPHAARAAAAHLSAGRTSRKLPLLVQSFPLVRRCCTAGCAASAAAAAAAFCARVRVRARPAPR